MRTSLVLIVFGVAAWGLVGAACSSSSSPATPGSIDSGADVAVPSDAAHDVAVDAACSYAASPPPFLPSPTGPYGIGRSTRRTVVDPVRDEPDTPDPTDKRRLSVEIWYPTDLCQTGGTEAPYLDPAEGQPFGSLVLAGPRTHAKNGVPMVADGKRHPVLVFSPGYGTIPRVYSMLLEEMVSQGYVVFTISHTFWSPLTTFADGTTVAGIKTLATDADGDAQIGVWIDDMRLVLDAIPTADANDADGTLTGRLDTGTIGAFGHSFGGATAVRLAASEPRLKVAVNLDGTIFGIGADEPDAGPPDAAAAGDAAVLDAGTPPSIATPFLLFRSDRDEDPSFTAVWAHATGTAYELVLKGTVHNSFADFGPVSERYRGAPAPQYGTTDQVRAIDVVNTYLLAFFAQHLLGTAPQPLLAGPSAAYPEIVFQKRP